MPPSCCSGVENGRSRDSSWILSIGSALNSEKRLLINLPYRATANSSVIPASCIYGAWGFDPALRLFPINSAAFSCINLEPELCLSRSSMVRLTPPLRGSSPMWLLFSSVKEVYPSVNLKRKPKLNFLPYTLLEPQ